MFTLDSCHDGDDVAWDQLSWFTAEVARESPQPEAEACGPWRLGDKAAVQEARFTF